MRKLENPAGFCSQCENTEFGSSGKHKSQAFDKAVVEAACHHLPAGHLRARTSVFEMRFPSL